MPCTLTLLPIGVIDDPDVQSRMQASCRLSRIAWPPSPPPGHGSQGPSIPPPSRGGRRIRDFDILCGMMCLQLSIEVM